MSIDLLLNNNAEVVSLSEQGMTITEYLYSFTSSEDAPATMMVNTSNGDLIRESLATAPAELPQNDVSTTASPKMTITVNDMLTDDDVMLFRAKPAAQGVGIGEALNKLVADIRASYECKVISRVIYDKPVTVQDGQMLNVITGEVK